MPSNRHEHLRLETQRSNSPLARHSTDSKNSKMAWEGHKRLFGKTKADRAEARRLRKAREALGSILAQDGALEIA